MTRLFAVHNEYTALHDAVHRGDRFNAGLALVAYVRGVVTHYSPRGRKTERDDLVQEIISLLLEKHSNEFDLFRTSVTGGMCVLCGDGGDRFEGLVVRLADNARRRKKFRNDTLSLSVIGASADKIHEPASGAASDGYVSANTLSPFSGSNVLHDSASEQAVATELTAKIIFDMHSRYRPVVRCIIKHARERMAKGDEADYSEPDFTDVMKCLHYDPTDEQDRARFQTVRRRAVEDFNERWNEVMGMSCD